MQSSHLPEGRQENHIALQLVTRIDGSDVGAGLECFAEGADPSSSKPGAHWTSANEQRLAGSVVL